MTGRTRSRTTRFLPEYVTSFKDRHGKVRYRFRRTGYPAGYFKSALGTEEFRAEYAAFNNPGAPAQLAIERAQARLIPGSVGEARYRYFLSPDRLGPTETTQAKVRAVLDRGFFIGREDRPLDEVDFEILDVIIGRRRRKGVDAKGRQTGGIEAARKLRKELVRFFDFAEAAGLIGRSPMKHVARVKVAPGERSTGFHCWTEDEIAQYRAHWPLGTKQRLAMELILWTDQRKVDAIHLGPQHVRGGKFVIRQTKTGKRLIIKIAAPLLAAIKAMPRNDALCFIVTEWGKPFSVKGFGGWFRDQCDAAGLDHCTAHGLRKATLRRMADLDMANKTLKSMSGHTKDDEVALYVESANQERLADDAIARLEAWEMSNLGQRLDTESA